jgi:hypothetical protein
MDHAWAGASDAAAPVRLGLDTEYTFCANNPFDGDARALERGTEAFQRGSLTEACLALEAVVKAAPGAQSATSCLLHALVGLAAALLMGCAVRFLSPPCCLTAECFLAARCQSCAAHWLPGGPFCAASLSHGAANAAHAHVRVQATRARGACSAPRTRRTTTTGRRSRRWRARSPRIRMTRTCCSRSACPT